MKKNLLVIVAVFLATSMSAQLYVGAKLGYGFGVQRQVLGTTTNGTNETNNYGSLGKGFSPALKVGYFFNENMGVEMGVDFLMGSKQDAGDVMLGVPSTVKASQINLLPALVLKTDMGIYGRFGAVVNLSSKETITGSGFESKVKSKMGLGFTSALGYNYALSDKLNIFGELEYIGLTSTPKSAETTVTAAGITVTTKTDFKDEAPIVSTNTALTDKVSSSSLRINVGVTYNL